MFAKRACGYGVLELEWGGMANHTRGPWAWHIDDSGIDLRTPHSGQLLVMDYGGPPTKRAVLRSAERTDNMGGLMQPAHNLVHSRHSQPGFVQIDSPDAMRNKAMQMGEAAVAKATATP